VNYLNSLSLTGGGNRGWALGVMASREVAFEIKNCLTGTPSVL